MICIRRFLYVVNPQPFHMRRFRKHPQPAPVPPPPLPPACPAPACLLRRRRCRSVSAHLVAHGPSDTNSHSRRPQVYELPLLPLQTARCNALHTTNSIPPPEPVEPCRRAEELSCGSCQGHIVSCACPPLLYGCRGQFPHRFDELHGFVWVAWV